MVLHLKSRLGARHVFRKYTPHNVIMMQISLSTLNLKVTLKMYNVLTCKYEKKILTGVLAYSPSCHSEPL